MTETQFPVSGILDVHGDNAFLRTDGYLPSPDDLFVPTNLVKRYGLRRGDELTGLAGPASEPVNHSGNNNRRPQQQQHSAKRKHDPLVRVDTVNGRDPDESRRRPEFIRLTPLYPQQRLRMETDPTNITGRVIDLAMPIGKGQQALIVAPPKAGKTMVLQAIANAITRNHPECHLMVLLVDERPEEVTDMVRSVKGEVLASTFDRPATEHTGLAELAIERAKRLVEQGDDVVVLLDSLTRLGRAYNNSAPSNGRTLTGGIDSGALYLPKQLLGAARKVENGGSLTIIATAMVETGSAGDQFLFEEFKGTGNAELRLDRRIAQKRIFPAVDLGPSGTRKEEILLAPDEYAIVTRLRKALSQMETSMATERLVEQLKKTRSNAEFLMTFNNDR